MGGTGGEGFGAEEVGDAAGAGSFDWLGGGVGGWGVVDGDTALEGYGAAGDGGDSGAGDEDAGEVERVGGGDGDGGFGRSGGALVAGLAEAVDGFREGVLLAEGAGDEAAAADLAAGFEAAEDGEEVAPLGGVGFAGEELAEEDAVAAEEDARVGVEGSVELLGGCDGGLGGFWVGAS